MSAPRPLRTSLRPALLLLTLAGTAWAHRLNVEATVEPGRVTILVYFSDGTAPEGAEVVASRDGVEVARGRTDATGSFSFAAAGRLRIQVTEPGLHRGQLEVEVPAAAVATIAAPTSATPAPVTTRVDPPRGGVDWLGSAGGLALIAALALGLAWWQRRGAVKPT